MGTQALTRPADKRIPAVFDEFFKPWNEWFEGGVFGRTMNMPAVNITEQKDDYLVALAAPGLKKEDFKIDIEGNMLVISCEKEEKKEEKDVKFTRKEYNFTSFERSFTLPDEVNKEKIEARYEEGVLKLFLPKKDEVKKMALNKHIMVK